MKLARYWKRSRLQTALPNGKEMLATGWGWSVSDPDEAQLRADEAVKRSAERIASGQGFPDNYGYPDRPAREEIVREITGEDGSLTAAITRNSYGSLILNTARLMFIDVDVTPKPAGLLDSLKGLFGIKAPDAFDTALERIRAAAATSPQYSFRVYRTAAGFRLAVTNKRIDPTGPESETLLYNFGSDRLYQRLCKNQESFRARLTPKHWRCNYESPRGRWPFETESDQATYRNWEQGYNNASLPYATCRFVEEIGNDRTVGEFRELIALHDSETRADSGRPLA
jgi:hypothetical protein